MQTCCLDPKRSGSKAVLPRPVGPRQPLSWSIDFVVSRRLALPLSTIHSLAYFLPVIEEVLGMRVSSDYFQYLRHKLARFTPPRRTHPTPAPMALLWPG